MNLEKMPFEKNEGKVENAGNQHFLLFTYCSIVFKGLFSWGPSNSGLFSEGIIVNQSIPNLNDAVGKNFRKH